MSGQGRLRDFVILDGHSPSQVLYTSIVQVCGLQNESNRGAKGVHSQLAVDGFEVGQICKKIGNLKSITIFVFHWYNILMATEKENIELLTRMVVMNLLAYIGNYNVCLKSLKIVNDCFTLCVLHGQTYYNVCAVFKGVSSILPYPAGVTGECNSCLSCINAAASAANAHLSLYSNTACSRTASHIGKWCASTG